VLVFFVSGNGVEMMEKGKEEEEEEEEAARLCNKQ